MHKKIDPNQKYINIELNLRGQQAGDELPTVALYRLDLSGRPVKKIAAVEDNVLNLPKDLAEKEELIALGPDVEQIEQLARIRSRFIGPRKSCPGGRKLAGSIYHVCAGFHGGCISFV